MLDLAGLRTELQTDPNGYGYAPHVALGADGMLAQLLNEKRSTITVNRALISTWEVIACTALAEYNALSTNTKDLYRTIVSAGTIDVNDPQIRLLLGGLFPAGTETRANLLARISRRGSRAEQLFGVGVSADDVAKALRG